MRLLVATDAWHPQVNGVVRTYEHFAEHARAMGHQVEFLTPQNRPSMPCPTYPEIRLALITRRGIRKQFEAFDPEFVHIATEGPIGLATRNYCIRTGRPFTTSYHTRFPEYVAARAPIPQSWSYAYMRRFHNAATAVMVATPSLEEELRGRGFNNLVRWSRGVDLDRYYPREGVTLPYPGPIFVYVGRVAVEKNLEAFLDLDLPGTKLIVGGGPALESLKARYKDAVFVGPKVGEELAQYYAGSDVFVFPSLTDTFGIVLLEAMASGLPVAAFPITGPIDVITDPKVGVLSNDLREAALAALTLEREDCVAFAQNYSWHASATSFFQHLHPLKADWSVPDYDH